MRTLTDDQSDALAMFLDMDWSVWSDNAGHFNCGEADRIAELFRAFDMADLADGFLSAHADDDDEGDWHNPDGSRRPACVACDSRGRVQPTPGALFEDCAACGGVGHIGATA